jgi:hypothetical protein
MLECPKCQYDNDLGRIFCAKCGEKLEINKISAPSGSRKGKKGRRRSASAPFSIGKFVARTIQIALLASLCATLVLLSLRPNFRPPGFGDHNASAFVQKRAILQAALANRAAAQIEFEEDDLNAILAKGIIDASKNVEPSNFRPMLEGVYLNFTEAGHVALTAQFKWKWYRFYPQIEASLVQGTAGGWEFKPAAARIGRFRIPMVEAMQNRFIELFKPIWVDMPEEQQWLHQLSEAKIEKGRFVAIIHPD